MDQWGVLQYFEEIRSPIGAAAKADALLGLYNQKTRTLTVKNAFGRPDIRAGSAVMVALDLGDITVRQFFVVDKVTHTFKENEHRMDLYLIGGEFIA